MAASWQSDSSAAGSSQPSLDNLVPELALVREAGLEPLEVEPLVPKLPLLAGLGVVRHGAYAVTALAVATGICRVIREAAVRLTDDPDPPGSPGQATPIAQAQMLLRVHYATKTMTAAEARIRTQEVSGVGNRQYRARHEARLLRLVAQAVLDLDHEDDLRRWGHALEVGADVPQSVALYWLYLFRDHYFRLETSAYALQTDLTTAHTQARHNMSSWHDYLATAVYWNVEFSYLRHRFFREHGPLWFAPTDEGCDKLNRAVERIEYHDPFPDEFMARLRRLYGTTPDPDHDSFTQALKSARLSKVTMDKAEAWLRRCSCPDGGHAERCEVGLVVRHCDIFGETVEAEFERIQGWYRTPRFAAEPRIKDLIENYRTPGREISSGD